MTQRQIQSGAVEVRRLTPSDIPAALELSSDAGWNQTQADWRMLLGMEPEGCLGIERDGRIVATATVIFYGGDLAWIGMVLTHRQYRHRGYANRLLRATLQLAEARQIATVKLDATESGQRIYAALGFTEEQPVERWLGKAPFPGPAQPGGDALDPGQMESLDRDAYGADRAVLLRHLCARGEPIAIGDEYLFHRSGRLAHYLGPCIAGSGAGARAGITSLLNSYGDKAYFWDLLPSNQGAVSLATELGFTRVRRLVRMRWGKPLPGKDELIYAIAGFELG